jgi:murein DD-endopeptidase MepM/ murein hydrolase activator NlpD
LLQQVLTKQQFTNMSAFDIDMSSPFRSGFTSGLGGPNSGGHVSGDWYNRFGMDLGAKEGTEVLAVFDAHITKIAPHNPSKDTSKEYGAQLFMRSPNDMMGGFYTHITDVPAGLVAGSKVSRGDLLGKTLRDHLHLALVEIIGGAPGGRYMGVDLYRHFLSMKDTTTVTTISFKQDGSPPTVI